MARLGIALVLGATAGGLFGYALGNRAPDDRETAALRQRLAHARRTMREQAERMAELAGRRVEEAARAAGHEPAPEEAPESEAGEAFPIELALTTAKELVAAIEGMTDRSDLYREDVLGFVQERLRDELAGNPVALEWAIAKFKAAAGRDPDVAGQLSLVLSGLKDPAVEAAGVELALAGAREEERVAGLELLSRLDIDNPETRSAVLEVLRTDPRPAVVSEAIYALNRVVPDPREARRVGDAVAPLLRHPDAEVRRRAVHALAEWATEPAGLEPAIEALRDPSPSVRAGAAFALSRARVARPGTAELLAERVLDEREDTAVREQAWRTLARLPLDDRTFEAYERFRELFEAAGEAGAPGHDGH